MPVAARVEALGASEDAICAAFFHDVLEDTPLSAQRKPTISSSGGGCSGGRRVSRQDNAGEEVT